MLLVCVHFGKKKTTLCNDLNSYNWRVVTIIEHSMMTIMNMIVKAVIKKHTCNFADFVVFALQ